MAKNVPTLKQPGSLVPNTPAQDTAEFRKLIPIEYIKAKTKDMMRNIPPRVFQDRVLIVESLTGSGKSTTMAAELYLELCQPSKTQMVVTQPRVMNAVTIPRDQVTPYYPQLRLGENIGWNTGKNKFKSNGLTYMTVGSFVETITVLSDDEIIDRYRVIMVDEVHEMSIELASMILSLKSLFLRNRSKNLPLLVFTSATFDWARFLKYFGIYDDAGGFPNLVRVAGKSYQRLDHMSEVEHGVSNYIEYAAGVIADINAKHPDDDPAKSDVLVFLPGKGEMEELKELLTKANKATSPYKVLMLDREAQTLNTVDYQELMTPANTLSVKINNKHLTPVRKVILSTNVAETGVTIDTLKYVVDPGYHKAKEYNPSVDSYVFVTRPASKFRLTQRKGRIGRKFDGEYYPLFPAYIYDILPDKSLGDVVLTDIAPYLLNILSEQVPELRVLPSQLLTAVPISSRLSINYPPVSPVELVDTPSGESMRLAYEKLFALGFVELDGDYHYHLTKLGALASKFRGVPIESLRMIFAGYFWGYSVSDLITIAAYLSTLGEFPGAVSDVDWKPVYLAAFQSYMFMNLHDSNQYVTKTRLLVADGFIEGLILFHGWCRTIDPVRPTDLVNISIKWCDEVGVDFAFIKAFVENRDRLLEKFIIAGLDPFKHHEKSFAYCLQDEFINMVTRVKYCIYDGYRLSILMLSPDNSHYISRFGLRVKVPKLYEDRESSAARKSAVKPSDGIARPRRFLYSGLTIKYSKSSKKYETKPTATSLMDGFVNLDDEFMSR